MARSRDLRPEFFTDEKVGELAYGERLLFAGIWCHSDLRGVFEYSAKQLRVLVFPFDEGLTSVTVQGWLESLESHGFIFRFEAEGKTWGCVKNWHHQGISGREKEIGSKRPEPPLDSPGTTQGVPGDNPGRTQVASPSPSPSPSPASACERARDEHDIGTPPPADTPPASDSDRWGYVRAEPWAKALIAAGCKIGPQNWPAWKALVESHNQKRVTEVAKTCPATERWPDRTETALLKSGGQAPIGQAVKHRIRSIE